MWLCAFPSRAAARLICSTVSSSRENVTFTIPLQYYHTDQ
jgi:hypothetical protein